MDSVGVVRPLVACKLSATSPSKGGLWWVWLGGSLTLQKACGCRYRSAQISPQGRDDKIPPPLEGEGVPWSGSVGLAEFFFGLLDGFEFSY